VDYFRVARDPAGMFNRRRARRPGDQRGSIVSQATCARPARLPICRHRQVIANCREINQRLGGAYIDFNVCAGRGLFQRFPLIDFYEYVPKPPAGRGSGVVDIQFNVCTRENIPGTESKGEHFS
jgi:hypothetical protein